MRQVDLDEVKWSCQNIWRIHCVWSRQITNDKEDTWNITKLTSIHLADTWVTIQVVHGRSILSVGYIIVMGIMYMLHGFGHFSHPCSSTQVMKSWPWWWWHVVEYFFFKWYKKSYQCNSFSGPPCSEATSINEDVLALNFWALYFATAPNTTSQSTINQHVDNSNWRFSLRVFRWWH